MSSMQRTWQRAYQRNHTGPKRLHASKNKGARYSKAPKFYHKQESAREQRFFAELLRNIFHKKG